MLSEKSSRMDAPGGLRSQVVPLLACTQSRCDRLDEPSPDQVSVLTTRVSGLVVVSGSSRRQRAGAPFQPTVSFFTPKVTEGSWPKPDGPPQSGRSSTAPLQLLSSPSQMSS